MPIINTKNYKYGNELLVLAYKIQKYTPKAIICVPATEISNISKHTKLKVYAQHVGYSEPSKRGTGYVTPEAVKEAGAVGTLLNHSEHKLSFYNLKRTVNDCKKIGLNTIVFAASLAEARKIKSLKPYAIAYEEPKLVASGKSITNYRAEEILKFVKLFENSEIIPLCGAGISDERDVKAALMLGCEGVLIASAIANSKNPEALLKRLGS